MATSDSPSPPCTKTINVKLGVYDTVLYAYVDKNVEVGNTDCNVVWKNVGDPKYMTLVSVHAWAGGRMGKVYVSEDGKNIETDIVLKRKDDGTFRHMVYYLMVDIAGARRLALAGPFKPKEAGDMPPKYTKMPSKKAQQSTIGPLAAEEGPHPPPTIDPPGGGVLPGDGDKGKGARKKG